MTLDDLKVPATIGGRQRLLFYPNGALLFIQRTLPAELYSTLADKEALGKAMADPAAPGDPVEDPERSRGERSERATAEQGLAFARFDLGLASEEYWWELTAGLTLALIERWEQTEFRRDLRAGIIAAVLAETHRDKKRKPEPFSQLDFMPLQKEL